VRGAVFEGVQELGDVVASSLPLTCLARRSGKVGEDAAAFASYTKGETSGPPILEQGAGTIGFIETVVLSSFLGSTRRRSEFTLLEFANSSRPPPTTPDWRGEMNRLWLAIILSACLGCRGKPAARSQEVWQNEFRLIVATSAPVSEDQLVGLVAQKRTDKQRTSVVKDVRAIPKKANTYAVSVLSNLNEGDLIRQLEKTRPITHVERSTNLTWRKDE
jgi:hypothetical protein